MLRAAGDPTRPPALLVKVGLQPYDVLRPPPGKDLSYFLEMDRATLLETIAGREFFTRSMNKLAILNCTVSVVRSIDTAQPTVKDLGHRKVLEGTQTLAEIAGNMAGNVFVHVLPGQCRMPQWVLLRTSRAQLVFTPNSTANPLLCRPAPF